MQMWLNIRRNYLNRLTKNRRYPGKPDISSKLPGLETPEKIDDNYGIRLTTYYMVSRYTLSSSQFYSNLPRI
jgi:hypothetical protein